MEASRDLFVIPDARGHEYVRIGRDGIRAKVGIDATVPLADLARYRRCEFADVEIDEGALSSDPGAVKGLLGK
jgi:2,5-furandicarboxylate decarboxylase 1